jgi:hypothetical protein
LGRNVDFFFYAFSGGLEKMSRINPYWKQQWIHTKLIPHAINRDLIPSLIVGLKYRSKEIGFKGLLDFNTMDKNPLVKYIYAERKRYIKFLESLNQIEGDNTKPIFFYEKNTNWNDYIAFMHDTKIAVNIPGIDGFINQRQYECLAFGCVLLQYYYDQLPELGFWGDPNKYPDKCNCLWFRNENELINRINWIHENPDKLQAIADRGRKWLIESDQTWQGRAKEMLNELTKEIPKEDLERFEQDQNKRKEIERLHESRNLSA